MPVSVSDSVGNAPGSVIIILTEYWFCMGLMVTISIRLVHTPYRAWNKIINVKEHFVAMMYGKTYCETIVGSML